MENLRRFEQEVDFHNSDLKYPTISFTVDSDKLWFKEQDIIIMTSESNPEVMAICFNQGWAANQDYMYKSEAEAVTDIGTAFHNGQFNSYDCNNFIYSFDEFKYFTSVTKLETNAFSNQYELVSIKLPESIYEIGTSAFNGCSSLSNVDIPSGVTSIGENAFNSCYSLSNIEIPSGITSIGESTFYNCRSLSEITCLAETAPTVSSYTFNSINNNGVLIVPSGSDYSTWKPKLPSGWTISYLE